MESSKNDKNWSRKAGWEALAATTLLTAFFCFWRLGADTILGFDEGRHAVNALEMYRNKDWIISTYNGEIDYFNLKPPLSMYMIMCGYALFGMNTFGIRVGSAFCYLLTALISAGYVAQKKSCWAASFTMLLFGSSKLLLFCSMARKGDANSFFNFCVTLSLILLLVLCDRKQKDAAKRETLLCIGMGLGCAAAFLSKSFHAAVPVLVILILFLRMGRKKIHPAEWMTFLASAAVPVLLWAVLRYQRDGLTFFHGMLFEDVVHRTQEKIAGTEGSLLYYFIQLFKENTSLIVLFLLGIYGALCIYHGASIKEGKALLRPDRLTLVLWILIPCVIYAVPTTKLITYSYPSYIALYICGGLLLPDLLKQTESGLGKVMVCLFVCFTVILSGINLKDCVYQISREQRDSLEELFQEHEDLFTGTGNIYTNHWNEYQGDVWYQDELLAVELYTPLHAKDGGIQSYLDDRGESYLILNYIWTEPDERIFDKGEGGETIYRDEYFRVIKKEKQH